MGSVIIVNVEYEFKGKVFESRTFSMNHIMVGGSRGDIASLSSNAFKVAETERYIFDNNTNTGKWQNSTDSYKMSYSVKGDELTLQPEGATIQIKLQRVQSFKQ